MQSAIQMKKLVLPLLGSILFLLSNAQPSKVIDSYYPLLRKTFVAGNAYKTVGFVEKYWRVAGNTGFNASIHHVEDILVAAGFKKEINGEADGPLTYRIETRKMRGPTWEPVSSSLTIVSESTPLLESVTNRNMITLNSASTPPEGETAELVYVGKASKADLEGKDLKGKILFGETSISSLYNTAMANGAIGALAYSIPAYTKPEKNIHSIQFSAIRMTDPAKQKWGILLSYNAKERLKAALSKGTVRVNVKVLTRIYPSDELTIIANARGNSLPNERFVFSAHVQEPGANDNATGVGTLAEMARVTATLINSKKWVPQRTITFLWGEEISSTRRYIVDDTVRAKGIRWGLSLDMVGEDVTKTSGSFLIEKMPDPSAIWTRGKEKHTEWGGTALKESDMFPHYFNDFLLNRCYQQAKSNGWVVNSNPFEGGSDHTPFLQAKIPGLLMWHFTDEFYHTDGDRLSMVSAEEMKNVGVSALAAAFTLASADEKTALSLVDEITANALARLQVEYELSKEVIAKGGNLPAEQHILEVWAGWYKDAIAKMTDIHVGGITADIQQKIASSQKKLLDKKSELSSLLGK